MVTAENTTTTMITTTTAETTESNKCGSNPACDGMLGKDKEAGAATALPLSPCENAEQCVSSCAAYGKVCPSVAKAAGRAACRAMQKLTDGSVLFAETPHFIRLHCSDLTVGKKKLGEGGFSEVHDVTLLSGDEEGQTFAIKFLKRKVMVQKRLFELGAADLATESMFLATLNHPHIIKYHGITAGSIESNVASCKDCGFFIVIDLLQETLENRIEQWADEANKNSGGLLYRMSHDYRGKRKAALMDRLAVAYQIADVMEYLHSLNIVYRDLKPENMGFDSNGDLKLFDFGLAKELKPSRETELGKYKLTGNTGSRRYMCPEVAKALPYDKSVDVYSFGILLWELCAMEKPFYGYSANKHMQQVVLGGNRPPLDTSHTQWWPVKLHWLLKRCWSEDSSVRPTFTVVKETLQDVMESNTTAHHHHVVHDAEQPESDSKLSMSHPHVADHGFSSMLKNGPGEPCARAVTTSAVLSPPTEGFGGIKPVAKNERAHTHTGSTSSSSKGHRKISLGLLGSMRKASPST